MQRPGILTFTTTQRYALLGVLFGFLFPIGATIIKILDNGLDISFANIIQVQSTEILLWVIDTAPFFLGLFAALAGSRHEQLQKTNTILMNAEKELKALQASLQERVEERTKALVEAGQKIERRSEQLKTIAEITRAVVNIRSLDELLTQLSRLISHSLGFYHVGIFLLDENREYALLRAANSEGGARMLSRGHRLRVGQQGIVGYAAARGVPRIALNVGEDAVYFNNPDLPNTHSEVALPLKFGTDVIGVLDIQSTEVNAFSQEDIEVFTILANQIAVAIQNTRSFEQAQRALREAAIASSRLTSQAWKDISDAIRTKGYRYDGIQPQPLKKADSSTPAKDTLTVPMQLRGQTIGRLKIKPSSEAHTWNEDELAIVESAAERIALALDGARLLDEAQKRAAREKFLSELAAKLGASFKLDSILRDTIEELGQFLKDSTVTFQLVNPSAYPSAGKENNEPAGRTNLE
ncbi:MAG: GAF domain-containing protein [Chloroflexota bacterium]|nr:GAF domain-containing protein [Chloroflexota bacterium]MBI5704215.1 GAF domain-containing protein [Chloroflexota bacterium]